MNRSKIYIGIAVAILLVALWMWWSKKSKKGSKEAPSPDDKPTPLAVDIIPEETDVTWSAQEITEEDTPLKEE